ncbi:putative fha domain-containing protein [Phaeoacremonium minimum UCRPA7]|uniref:Putative fha domain-containing protein n=1 Tax=Phaeoacremonium minimum (strain UCR-PA7) TaxID=1286976 RepID=R8BTI8_PHAM7|nr:putative fha domain-containing protein [Phaeoacremonium minimum UCRPA7]EOO02590.1 putative fha domain-containing protein [Phaeoacremonium minimum UCRPA7]
MSRDHAELVADLDTRTVCIRDIGSLHGTFINSEQDRIDNNTERPLATGDTIKFGVPIWRGKDAFAPTTVGVGLEFTASVEVNRNVFKVPEYNSDLEESDSESELEDESDEPDTTIHTGVYFNNQVSDHIDLTKDDEKRASVVHEIVQLDGAASQRVIDLTSPLREESPGGSFLGNHDDRAASEDGASVVASEDQFRSENDVDFDRDSSIRLTEEEDGIDFSDEDSDSDAEDKSDMSSERSEDLEGSEEEADYSSDDEPLEDGDHGLMAWPDADVEVELAPIALQDMFDTPLPPLNTSVPTTNLLPSILPNAPLPATIPLPPINAAALREPSPSDAAMMKSSVKTQTITKPMMEILKEKTGKHAFFDAREENKAALARQSNTYPSPPNAQPVKQTSDNVTQKPPVWLAQPMPDAQEPIDPIQPASSSQPLVKSAWLSTGNDFLNSPQEGQDQPEDEADSEAEAMTSAYNYHLWKQSRSQESETGSRRIGINDIVVVEDLCDQAPDSAQVKETPRKRKAAAISTATQEEQIWHNEQRDEAPTADAAVQPLSPPASPVEPVPRLAADTSRPTKRMRRIAERVGYAALGGATVGAMIVTSLIYTAPSFA